MRLTLYYRPMACSLAARVLAAEASLELDYIAVNLVTAEVVGGGDLHADVPRGQVPALRRADGSLLMENSAVLLYLSAQAPGAALVPEVGTDAYWRTLEALSFVGTELHKRCLYPYYNLRFPQGCRDQAAHELKSVLAALEAMLAPTPVWRGPEFGAVDAYLVWALLLAQRVGDGLAAAPAAQRYLADMMLRPSVTDAVALEMAEARQMGR